MDYHAWNPSGPPHLSPSIYLTIGQAIKIKGNIIQFEDGEGCEGSKKKEIFGWWLGWGFCCKRNLGKSVMFFYSEVLFSLIRNFFFYSKPRKTFKSVSSVLSPSYSSSLLLQRHANYASGRKKLIHQLILFAVKIKIELRGKWKLNFSPLILHPADNTQKNETSHFPHFFRRRKRMKERKKYSRSINFWWMDPESLDGITFLRYFFVGQMRKDEKVNLGMPDWTPDQLEWDLRQFISGFESVP